MKTVKSDWAIYQEALKEGKVAHMSSFLSIKKSKELTKKLEKYFKEKISNHKGIWEEEDGEEVLLKINKYMKENQIDKQKISYPRFIGSNGYVIPVGENIQFKLLVVDEYYGHGERQTYVEIEEFIVNENAKEKDVDQLVELMKELYKL